MLQCDIINQSRNVLFGSRVKETRLFQPITIPFAWSAGGGAGAEKKKKKIGTNYLKRRKL